jgi:hypothetical protein
MYNDIKIVIIRQALPTDHLTDPYYFDYRNTLGEGIRIRIKTFARSGSGHS